MGVGVRIFRLPDASDVCRVERTFTIPIAAGRDNPLFVRVTQEDGHQAWSSPIYVIAEH